MFFLPDEQERQYVVCIFTFDRCPYAYQFVVSVVSISTDLRTIAFFSVLKSKMATVFVRLEWPDARNVSLNYGGNRCGMFETDVLMLTVPIWNGLSRKYSIAWSVYGILTCIIFTVKYCKLISFPSLCWELNLCLQSLFIRFAFCIVYFLRVHWMSIFYERGYNHISSNRWL